MKAILTNRSVSVGAYVEDRSFLYQDDMAFEFRKGDIYGRLEITAEKQIIPNNASDFDYEIDITIRAVPKQAKSIEIKL
jgi:hypothetical protein